MLCPHADVLLRTVDSSRMKKAGTEVSKWDILLDSDSIRCWSAA